MCPSIYIDSSIFMAWFLGIKPSCIPRFTKSLNSFKRTGELFPFSISPRNTENLRFASSNPASGMSGIFVNLTKLEITRCSSGWSLLNLEILKHWWRISNMTSLESTLIISLFTRLALDLV
jgi:hypothetical protein